MRKEVVQERRGSQGAPGSKATGLGFLTNRLVLSFEIFLRDWTRILNPCGAGWTGGGGVSHHLGGFRFGSTSGTLRSAQRSMVNSVEGRRWKMYGDLKTHEFVLSIRGGHAPWGLGGSSSRS